MGARIGEGLGQGSGRVDLVEARADGGIVVGGGAEDFPGEPPFGIEGEFAAGRAQFREDCGVIFRRGDDGDVLVVLGGGAQHGGPADVDVLDQFLEVGAGLRGYVFEAVEVDHHHVDGGDAVRLYGCHVFGVGAHGEDAAGDFGMHGLDAAIQHFGKSGDVADVGDGNPASRSRRAVPPVEMSSAPIAARAEANSRMPVLSVTLRSTREIFAIYWHDSTASETVTVAALTRPVPWPLRSWSFPAQGSS